MPMARRTSLRFISCPAMASLLFFAARVTKGLTGTQDNCPVALRLQTFVGNSFTFGAESPPVQGYRPEDRAGLNHEDMGGEPALFKAFTREAGLAYDVNLETASGMNLDFLEALVIFGSVTGHDPRSLGHQEQ